MRRSVETPVSGSDLIDIHDRLRDSLDALRRGEADLGVHCRASTPPCD
jgi:hypothetical protein